MADTVTIAVDVMGGDRGPAVILGGAEAALSRRAGIRYQLFGNAEVIGPLLRNMPKLSAVSMLHHCDVAVAMNERPSQALRHGRWRSSMWRSIEAVKKGEADFTISAGNTGALMAMARFCLRTLADIERPAIAAQWPTLRGMSIVLDVGASIGADARQLIDLAVMGGAMARALLNIPRPTVGLLNIGVEEVKGLDEIKAAHAALKETPLPIAFRGFVEGDDIGHGAADVIVTDGFTGNVALKTAEGTAKQIGEYFRAAMRRSLLARIGAVFAQGAFRALKEKMDPRQLNGGIFLGLNGIVVKSHGGTDATGFASAVDLAYDMASNGVVKRLADDVGRFHAELELDGAA
jgi:glycerol-3-phosphate acyltransferase PlsX